ncbi:MAG: hypothetical protein R3B09_06025 [Nannocystaceae bacterium]
MSTSDLSTTDATTIDENTTSMNDTGRPDACARHVFVSSTTTYGDLGGIAKADKVCTSLAKEANLPGALYLAWISTPTNHAITRYLQQESDPNKPCKYVLADEDQTTLSLTWEDFRVGKHEAPFNRDEYGVEVNDSPFAWTNTKPDGTAKSTNDCDSWTTDGSYGEVGLVGGKEKWSVLSVQSCGAPAHLYCIQMGD